jgi:hypothetical protein
MRAWFEKAASEQRGSQLKTPREANSSAAACGDRAWNPF